jgi:hypothetical protein
MSCLKSRARGLATLAISLLAMDACSHAKTTRPVLSDLEGKKVALVEIDGEPTARAVVEVALINQLLKQGTFEIISKQDLAKARNAPGQDPRDWTGIAKAAGADYALKAKVLNFDSEVHDGYSNVEVDDSEMAAEMGEKARKTQRLYKVKKLDGNVRVQLDFAHLESRESKDADLRSAVAQAEDHFTADEQAGAIHLPPRLRFLETIANQAFSKFFADYR